MPSLAITHGVYSQAEPVVSAVARETGMKVFTDEDVIAFAVDQQHLKSGSLHRIFNGHTPAFNSFTHEREKSLAAIKLTLSRILLTEDVIIKGLSAHLIPASLSVVLRCLIIADRKNRIHTAMQRQNQTDTQAKNALNRLDEVTLGWCHDLHGKSAWDTSLYDLVIPTHKIEPQKAAELIQKSLSHIALDPSQTKALLTDFHTACRLEMALIETGQGLSADVKKGHAVITLNKNVLMLSRFKEKVINEALKVDGVKSAETRIGKGFYKANVMYDFDPPVSPRVLLVDDEKEFTQTLSDRLRLRDLTPTVAHGGEEALSIAEKGETDVMVLDLKMPGVNGYEVLKKVREEKPNIEVIILTGHGSEEDKKRCLSMGAFAYLQKPADIDLLTETMKAAYEANRPRKKA
ncbi:MAG: response regulator [Desulfobacterales bacterium]|nr:response regulator [Desulfobacterales bacterium]